MAGHDDPKSKGATDPAGHDPKAAKEHGDAKGAKGWTPADGERRIGAEERRQHAAPVRPYQEFPKMVYRRDEQGHALESRTVQSKDEQDKLGEGWS